MNLLIAFMTACSLTLNIQEKNDKGGQWLSGCSAVYVSPTTALTAAHCFEEKFTGKAWAKDHKGESYPVEVLFLSKAKDLALIKVHGPKHKYARLAQSVQKGQNVYTINAGGGTEGNYNQGVVSNTVVDSLWSNTIMIIHTASIQRGASGSGLFDKKGRLIGINVGFVGTGLTRTVDSQPMRHFLEQQEKAKDLPYME